MSGLEIFVLQVMVIGPDFINLEILPVSLSTLLVICIHY